MDGSDEMLQGAHRAAQRQMFGSSRMYGRKAMLVLRALHEYYSGITDANRLAADATNCVAMMKVKQQ